MNWGALPLEGRVSGLEFCVRSPALQPESPIAPLPAACRDGVGVSGVMSKKTVQRHGFRTSESIVYPAHGVGKIIDIEEQVVAGMKLELFVINFQKDKMTLRVPVAKAATVGMRK